MPATPCPFCTTPVPEGANYCLKCGRELGDKTVPVAAISPELAVQDQLGKALGNKYEVRRLLGEGGFAQVFEVWDRDLQRKLAVKVLKPDMAWSPAMLERFKQEARAIARLTHSNILPIFFVGDNEGLAYYAMPFVDGVSLADLLQTRGALDPDRALAIARPILEALAHAHENGLVHRDIKPENVMLEASSGRPLLVDFGIAKRLDGSVGLTQTGFVVGSPQYMSPEQALGQGDVDARTDIYAMGAMLFQMVTGTPPYEGATSQEVVGKHLSEPVPIATSRDARIPMWLSEVIVRCMAKRPGERFQSAKMLLQALNSGRLSGPQETVSADRVAKRIQDETVALPTASKPAAVTVVTPKVTPAAAQPPSRSWGKITLLGLLLGLGALVLLSRGHPTLVVENHLVEPIRVVIEGQAKQVAAGAIVELPIKRGRALTAQWYLVRPIGPSGQPLGVDMQGTITELRPRGRVTRRIDASSGEIPVFAPLITNGSSTPIKVTVNAGLVGATPCDCSVRPGSTRAHIGYYTLFENSTVEAATSGDARARFSNLGVEADRETGAVGLRFEDKDFR